MRRLVQVVVLSLTSALAGWAAPPVPLTSVAAIRALSKAEASKSLPVAFEATVTYFHPDFLHLMVQDQGHAIFVFTPVGTQLAPGDRVLIKGKTDAEFSPDVLSDSITVLHHGTMPKAIPANFAQLMDGKLDCILVSVRGRVRAANLVLRPDVRSPITFTSHVSYLELLTDGGYVNVIVNTQDEKVLKDLLDADVEVTGAAGGMYDGKWHQTEVLLRTFSFSDVKVLKRASTSPWSLPFTPMDKVLTGYHIRDLTPRVRVQGTITYYQPGYYRPGSAIVLQNGSESLWVQSLTDKPLRIGDLVTASGIPDVASGSLTLTHAEVEDTQTQAPVTPVKVDWRELAEANLVGRHHNDLVSIEGEVVMEAREASQDEYVLTSDGQLFSAVFHHADATSELSTPPMKEVPVGSRVRVTGICILQDTTLFSGKAPFNILLRTFDDIAVVANPTVLNMGNLIRLVSLLLVVVVTVGVWNWTLQRKVRRQTAALTMRVEAEAAMERRAAQLEQQRSRILEDINGSAPLAGILEEIAKLVSFGLDGVPCWCEVTDGARLGDDLPHAEGLRVVCEQIFARGGMVLGGLFAAFEPGSVAVPVETETLTMGTRLATLAMETRALYSDLLHRSEFDLLTDIRNRFSLDKLLDAKIETARRNAGIFGLIYIDLDEFKLVNDLYGHHVGDVYLQEVALRMKRQLRSADRLARLGGDEFAVLVPIVRNRAEVQEIAQRLEHCFNEPFAMDGFTVRGSASVGIALYPEDGATRDKLLNAADAAMYVAKNAKQKSV
jgi:diguanylate cyclase (GGDEF)-like protein